jgi:hypothetical protein
VSHVEDYYQDEMVGSLVNEWLFERKSMADNITTLVYRGKLQYAKVLGDPVPNYAKDGKEWKFDFIPNDDVAAAKELKALGVGDRLRSLEDGNGNPRYDGRKYMSFKQKAERADGSPNKPIQVLDIKGRAWPEDVLIGNETVVDLKFVVIDNGKGRFNGMYPRSIRILDLVPYANKEFEALPDDDEFLAKAEEQERMIKMLAGNAPKAPKHVDEDDLDDVPFD